MGLASFYVAFIYFFAREHAKTGAILTRWVGLIFNFIFQNNESALA
ncbi:hypothetical protein CFter6_2879 [Collimonas fungivorans]|uniref:Uncharacterized protein n=1 Tax=Collimonas fungivorans TaxID=158899 RepID=A0A127PCZ8_9BURK|nr:hypothetical protein CFter6_2879 [Collimonas fungivorans]